MIERIEEPAPSGEQYPIAANGYRAIITEVGATLRELTYDGQPLIIGFGAEEAAYHVRGQLLAPWVNRIRDGRYTWRGTTYQLDLSEPDRSNAAQGLVRWAPWILVEHAHDAVTLSLRLRPQSGWAWTLDLQVRYALGPDGLTVHTSATNRSRSAAPFGYGAHPYLTAGETRVDEVTLTLPATAYLHVDPERLLPVADRIADAIGPVAGDAALPKDGPLGDAGADLAYTGLAADSDGRWRVTLAGPERSTTLWAQAERFSWVQIFTGDPLPGAFRRASGIAVEPLTSPPNAFVTGEDVVTLEPDQTWSAEWGITVAPVAHP